MGAVVMLHSRGTFRLYVMFLEMKKTFLPLIALLILCLSQSCKSNDDLTPTDTVDLDDDKTTAVINDTYTYQLPVIFHVFYKNARDTTQYIRDGRLRMLLNRVNEIYQGGIYGESENLNVRFLPATHDEHGRKLSTPGVEYILYDGTFPVDQEKFISSSDNRKYLWDLNEYINVMVFPFTGSSNSELSNVLGITSLPIMKDNEHAQEGLQKVDTKGYTLTKANLKYTHCTCLNSSYVYQESTRYGTDKGRYGYTYRTTDANVTLAHELGHYLGLTHVFAEDKNGYSDNCMDTDHCEDTPSYNRIEYENNLQQILNTATGTLSVEDLARRSPCSGEPYISANIMDYAVTLAYKISRNQKERMRQVLYYGLLMPGPRKDKTTRAARTASDIVVEHGTFAY